MVSAGVDSDVNPRSPINGEGSSRIRAKSAVSPFRRLRLEGGSVHRDGKQNHVDSLILHGRKVAREFAAEDSSCEIVSEFRGKGDVVERGEKGGDDGVGLIGTGQHPEKTGEMLTGDLGVTAMPRVEENRVRGQVSVEANKDVGSTSLLLGDFVPLCASGPETNIPGIGPYVGQADFASGSAGRRQGLGRGFRGAVGPDGALTGDEPGSKKLGG
ncbi:hypothetical protein COLO4_20027 [Corchorus olitorius]|uniref:Uncharacterized protein n=1 Tax=Corchorus olitorius TaxID=93759 RepID=A0A1R3J258_9ROSI|nr:hypothetical protein COLO4_20027 [Corchorus olitorius]